MIVLFLIFWGTTILVSKVPGLIHIFFNIIETCHHSCNGPKLPSCFLDDSPSVSRVMNSVWIQLNYKQQLSFSHHDEIFFIWIHFWYHLWCFHLKIVSENFQSMSWILKKKCMFYDRDCNTFFLNFIYLFIVIFFVILFIFIFKGKLSFFSL